MLLDGIVAYGKLGWDDIFTSGQLRCQSPNNCTLKSLIKCGAPISPFVLEIILDLYETSNYPCLLV